MSRCRPAANSRFRNVWNRRICLSRVFVVILDCVAGRVPVTAMAVGRPVSVIMMIASGSNYRNSRFTVRISCASKVSCTQGVSMISCLVREIEGRVIVLPGRNPSGTRHGFRTNRPSRSPGTGHSRDNAPGNSSRSCGTQDTGNRSFRCSSAAVVPEIPIVRMFIHHHLQFRDFHVQIVHPSADTAGKTHVHLHRDFVAGQPFIRIVPHDFRDLFVRGQPVCILPAGRSGHAKTLHGRIGRMRRNLQNGAEHWMILPAVIPAAPR